MSNTITGGAARHESIDIGDIDRRLGPIQRSKLKNPRWRLKRAKLAAKDRNLHPVAILNSTARTTRWTGTASEKNAQFLRAKFEK